MSGLQFTFPPPPPAPPKAIPSYAGAPQPFAAGLNGSRGRGDGKEYGNHGHGRDFIRGGGGSGRSSSTQSRSSYRNPSLGTEKRHPSSSDTSYDVQTNDYRKSGYSLPHYPPVQLPQFPTNVLQGYGPQNQSFPPNAQPPSAGYPANGSGSYQKSNGQHQYSSQGYGPILSNLQTPSPAAQNNNSFQTNVHASQPVLMGPPIRMGFDARRIGGLAQQHAPTTANGTQAYQHARSDGSESPYRHNSSVGFRSGGHASLSVFSGNRGRGQRREHGENHNRTRYQNQRTQVAPAVPSFGSQLPLPIKPPALHGDTRTPNKKKKRRSNQLGLTPKVEEHESSEEEDDTDEEAKFAGVTSSAGQGHQVLQFNYKGRVSTLQSSSDIIAWIEERKKRFPTRARAAQIAKAKHQSDNQQRAADQVPTEARDKQKSELQKRKRQKMEVKNQQKRAENPSEDAAKSKRKIEKLRKQLEKEEKRIAKAEAHASKEEIEYNKEADKTDLLAFGNENKKRKRSDSYRSCNAKIEDSKRIRIKLQEAQSMVPDPLTPTLQPALADEERYPLPGALNADDQVKSSTGKYDNEASSRLDPSVHDSSISTSDSTSDSASDSASTDFEDSTSSSGSSSGRDSEYGAPDETSTQRDRPERVAPPKRTRSKQICRAFLHKGLCKRGSYCKYLHELPRKGRRGMMSMEVERTEGRKERVGLYQRLVEQEKEQEDHKILEAIPQIGKNRLLEEGVQAVDEDGNVS